MATRFSTVRVRADAVRALANDPSDPIVDVLEGVADQIRENALENIRKIFKGRDPGVDIDVEVGQDTKGLFVRVTPDGMGRLSSYLTFKESREHSWLQPAIAAVLGQGGIRSVQGRAFRNIKSTFPRGTGF